MPDSPHPSLRPEEWLTEQFIQVDKFDPHFESSWYGLRIALLSHYFPYQQKFLIKPQPRIVGTVKEISDISCCSVEANASMSSIEEDIFASDDISVTSTGALTMPGLSYHIPDFTVTKATQFATHDKLLLLVEIKPPARTEYEWMSYATQMGDYMEAAVSHLEDGASLIALLICGTSVQVRRVSGCRVPVTIDAKRYSLHSGTIRQLLRNIAKDNWA